MSTLWDVESAQQTFPLKGNIQRNPTIRFMQLVWAVVKNPPSDRNLLKKNSIIKAQK